MEENCLTQLVRKPTREGFFETREGLVGDVVVGGHLGHRDHGIIKLLILGEEGAQLNCYFGLLGGRFQPL